MPKIFHDSIVENNIIYRKQADNTLILTGVKDVIDKDTMEHIIIPENVQNMPVVAIGDKAFYRYNHIRNIKLPATLTKVGKSAFAYCQRLECIHFKSDIVTFDCAVFCGCGKLKTVSGWTFEAIDYSTFEGCSRLETIDACFIGEIKQNTFLNCKRLLELYFDDGIIIHKNVFIGCMSVNKMFFESNVTIDDDAIGFIAKRNILCKPDCPLVELSYSGTNVVLRS